MQQPNPILVVVTRGPAVESIHRGAAAVVDRSGDVVASWGDVDHAVYPRSAVKPIQAIPMLTSGAAGALGVSRDEIALACASHNGEAIHTDAVKRWLDRIGYGPGTLECGAHPPHDADTRRELELRGEPNSPLHNNCSGKHAGFLTICRHMGFPTAGYIRADHPVQQMVRNALEEFTGSSLSEAPCGVDGCGIPVYAIPLRGLATAMMKLGNADGRDEGTTHAARAVRDAMISRPYLVAGRHRFCTEVMEALAPHVLVKTGAEGVFCAALSDRGLGIALKIDDGASRAAEVAIGGVLRSLDAISDSRFAALRSRLEPAVVNVAGREVGVIKVSPGLLGGAA